MKVIVVSHGDLARGLVGSAQMLAGEQENLLAFGLYPKEDREVLEEKIRGELENTPPNEEVLILSDIFHGSPFNVCVRLSEHYAFRHVTGINLPMLIEVLMDRLGGKRAEEICSHILEDAPSTIKDVNKLLSEEKDGEDDE